MTIIKYRDFHEHRESPGRARVWSSIWTTEGQRRTKANAYFDTWGLAHQWMTAEAERTVRHTRRQLELANARLGNIKGMKEPSP